MNYYGPKDRVEELELEVEKLRADLDRVLRGRDELQQQLKALRKAGTALCDSVREHGGSIVIVGAAEYAELLRLSDPLPEPPQQENGFTAC